MFYIVYVCKKTQNPAVYIANVLYVSKEEGGLHKWLIYRRTLRSLQIVQGARNFGSDGKRDKRDGIQRLDGNMFCKRYGPIIYGLSFRNLREIALCAVRETIVTRNFIHLQLSTFFPLLPPHNIKRSDKVGGWGNSHNFGYVAGFHYKTLASSTHILF